MKLTTRLALEREARGQDLLGGMWERIGPSG